MGLYYNINNLPPPLRNFLGNIHVLALARNKDIEEFGINEILRPFVYELKQIEQDCGINIKINNKNFTLRASLFRVCADTVAAHSVLGFLGPSANLFSRLCTITSSERKCCSYTEAPLRTKESCEQDLMNIKINKEAQSTTGVKEDSILNELWYFYCTSNYVLDCMHDRRARTIRSKTSNGPHDFYERL